MRYIFILFLTLISIQANTLYPKTLSLAGEWQYHLNDEPQAEGYVYSFKADDPTMLLPNNWYKQGVNHAGIIWFKKEIYTRKFFKELKHFLEFKGVDYLCDVWINGRLVGSHKGYFQTFQFDISDYLRAGKNSIVVKVNSPLENYPQNYSLHKTLLRGIFAHHDTRPGGAWSAKGQDRNSGGIWNDISIKSYKKHKFEAIKITPTLRENSVDLNIKFDLKKFQKPLLNFPTPVKITVAPANFEGESFVKEFELKDEKNQQISFELEGAKRWTTHDRGFPYLYNVTLETAYTKHTLQTGFKSLVQNKNKAHFLNGESIYLKGTNYISSQYMSEMDEEALRQDLELMKQAHINTIRVHAHIEPTRFYKLCDEMGFLVWQDYNLQWGYSESKAFEQEALKQALEMVDFLYNHPSIYIWTMHNEPPWDSTWMKWKYPNYNPKQNKRLDEKLYEAVSAYDRQHITKKVSSNIEHPWYGWYSQTYADFVKPSKAQVITEYGAQAIPNFESLKKFVPNKYLKPNYKQAKEHWEYHNFQFKNAKDYGIEFKGSVKEFIKDSQQYQYDLIKFATEMLRIQKYDTTTAIFQFMFKEGWPSMNWGVVDYYLEPKMGYRALKEAYAPVIVVAKQTPENKIQFFVVNDMLQAIEGATFHLKLDTHNKRENYDYVVTVQKDSLLKLGTVLRLENEVKMLIELKDKEGKTLATNGYDFSPLRVKNKKDKQ
ncbi:MAG: Beta-mannosidase (EC [uncultured Sulfurovum sp.]|uniref:beta-mannosidase n=1 Tax=uncultured Sulfurovum sp. TaxID=269237 RepID=A0A6S6TTH2_9BACT|nr:MAG: Beta-mannosidase (EC [uncultured Sulfurovum sp.]